MRREKKTGIGNALNFEWMPVQQLACLWNTFSRDCFRERYCGLLLLLAFPFRELIVVQWQPCHLAYNQLEMSLGIQHASVLPNGIWICVKSFFLWLKNHILFLSCGTIIGLCRDAYKPQLLAVQTTLFILSFIFTGQVDNEPKCKWCVYNRQ